MAECILIDHFTLAFPRGGYADPDFDFVHKLNELTQFQFMNTPPSTTL